ncbi:hypothetical protein VNO77_25413 [Canavalia gladiata]|uniref:Uncharacterized protein n=1 Tax=Canavalia gladiata TaxID=3824 RepID=A0AAN9L826_CANGL
MYKVAHNLTIRFEWDGPIVSLSLERAILNTTTIIVTEKSNSNNGNRSWSLLNFAEVFVSFSFLSFSLICSLPQLWPHLGHTYKSFSLRG